MITGIFHYGSGAGNQLARYVMTRVLATGKGYDWGMHGWNLFKGESFMELEKGSPVELNQNGNNFVGEDKWWYEKKVLENGVDIRGYDPEINFVEDGTIIDGEFQDERYFEHRLPEVKEWLKVEPLEVPDNVCVINFRGGEYKLFPELFLTKDYWEEAIVLMKGKNPVMLFEVHTDDPQTAREFFPEFPIIENTVIGHSLNTNMGYNWRALRYAKYAIISNSSFAILPRLIRHLEGACTVAPRYWSRRNTKTWALSQNYYKSFLYI